MGRAGQEWPWEGHWGVCRALTLLSPRSPLPARDRWSKLDCSLSASVTKHRGVFPGPPHSLCKCWVRGTHGGCWPPAVFHAEITGVVDRHTQEGLPFPQTSDPSGFPDSAGLPICFWPDSWPTFTGFFKKLPLGCYVSVPSLGDAYSGIFFFC